MTGFARIDGAEDGYNWVWELRSVNSRSLDVRLRLPNGMDHIETGIRNVISERLTRGNISVSLTLFKPPSHQEVLINTEVLNQILGISKKLSESHDVSPPSVDGLLAIRGVLEVRDEEENDQQRKNLEVAVSNALGKALDELVQNRYAEGERLAISINRHLNEIESLVAEASAIDETQPAVLAKRMREQIRSLANELPALTEERLAQEVAILAVKGDIREELDRLSAHVEGGRELIVGGSPVGRKLDFLCQEFNREANTVCSKSSALNLTRVGLELKAVIERLREQIQNIE
jgi:uncharacterized protein (TIGR00255 family)